MKRVCIPKLTAFQIFQINLINTPPSEQNLPKKVKNATKAFNLPHKEPFYNFSHNRRHLIEYAIAKNASFTPSITV